MSEDERAAIMNRWNTRTSFYSRHSRRFPSYSFAELNRLMKERARATWAACYIRNALEKSPLLSITKLGHSLRDQFYSNAWWRTWKTQWELASNQSRRTYYGLGPDPKIPGWTRRADSRVTLPTKGQLKKWRQFPDEGPSTGSSETSVREQTQAEFDKQLADFKDGWKINKAQQKAKNLAKQKYLEDLANQSCYSKSEEEVQEIPAW